VLKLYHFGEELIFFLLNHSPARDRDCKQLATHVLGVCCPLWKDETTSRWIQNQRRKSEGEDV